MPRVGPVCTYEIRSAHFLALATRFLWRDDVPAWTRERTPSRVCPGLRGVDVGALHGCVCTRRALPRRRGGVREGDDRASWCRAGRAGVRQFTSLASRKQIRRRVCGRLSRLRRLHEFRLGWRRECPGSCAGNGRELSSHQSLARRIFPRRARDRFDHRYPAIDGWVYPRPDTARSRGSRCSRCRFRQSSGQIHRDAAGIGQPVVRR